MENQTQPTIQPLTPVQPPAPQPSEPPMKLKKPLPRLPLIITAVMLVLAISLPFGGYLLLGRLGIHPKPSTVTIKITAPSPTPTSIKNLGKISVISLNPKSTSSGSWKTYTNTEFGFAIKYPAQGDIVLNIPDSAYNPDKTYIGDCGDTIKETTDPILTHVSIDSLFTIAIYNSTKSIADWIKDQPVDFRPDLSYYIPFSGVNADEAYREKTGLSLMNFAFYRKNNHIIILSNVQNLADGCINYDTKIYNWDIPTSFKFVQ